jgi:hypothetical protein
MPPTVQVKNLIKAGRVRTDSSSITNPISATRGSCPVPIIVKPAAYTAAAAGL